MPILNSFPVTSRKKKHTHLSTCYSTGQQPSWRPRSCIVSTSRRCRYTAHTLAIFLTRLFHSEPVVLNLSVIETIVPNVIVNVRDLYYVRRSERKRF